MSWLTEFVRPKIRTLFTRSSVPDNLWHQCPACQQMIFHRDLLANRKVCPHCGHHMRATTAERLDWTFDDNAYTRIELPKTVVDPTTHGRGLQLKTLSVKNRCTPNTS